MRACCLLPAACCVCLHLRPLPHKGTIGKRCGAASWLIACIAAVKRGLAGRKRRPFNACRMSKPAIFDSDVGFAVKTDANQYHLQQCADM